MYYVWLTIKVVDSFVYVAFLESRLFTTHIDSRGRLACSAQVFVDAAALKNLSGVTFWVEV